MKENSIAKMKRRLQEEKNLLEQRLSEFAEKNKEIKGDWTTKFPEIGMEGSEDALDDAAKQREEYERLLPVEHVLELKLQRINLALEKIEKGKYGICENCGKEISKERLSIIPEAELCKDCKNINKL